jgi:hypothetical protein
VSMIDGLIRGKALRGVNKGGIGRRVFGRWAHMRCNASKVERIRNSNKKITILFL